MVSEVDRMVSDDRGQLLLVAAVLIALVIVASAVLLNGLLVPESATAAALSADATDLERSVQPVRTDPEGLFENTTTSEPLPHADEFDLRDNVRAYRGLVLNETALRRGSILNVTYNGSAGLTGHAVQQRTDGAFTDNGGARDWQLAAAVTAVPRARFTVTDQHTSFVNQETAIVVQGSGSQQWSLNVSDDRIFVEGTGVAGARQLCDATTPPGAYPGDEVVVDVRMARQRNATVEIHDGGDVIDCEPFRFGGGVTGDWDVLVRNGHEADGRYVVTFEGSSAVGAGSAPRHVGSNLVINPGFDVRYVTEGIEYESTFALYNVTR